MNIFALYPHIYSRFAKNGILLYNNENNEKLVLPPSQSKQITKLRNGFVEISKRNELLISYLSEKQFGYYAQCSCPPIFLNTINFTSSKSKLAEWSGIRDGSDALSFIDKISLFVDGIEDDSLNRKIAAILDFPSKSISNSEIQVYLDIFSSISFPNLKEIEIVSTLSDKALALAEVLKKQSYLITFKTIITDQSQIAHLQSIKANDILYKIYAKSTLIPFVSSIKNDNLYFTFWSDNLNEIIEHPEKVILPILYDTKAQKVLYEQVLLSWDDILSINRTLHELRYNSLFNATFMGNIKFYGKNIIVGNQIICTVSNFVKEFPNWLFNIDNLWFYSRRKKSVCRDCIFSDLCPSISLLEVLGIIERPCSLIFKV